MLDRLGRLARAPFGLSKAQRARREVVRGNHLLRRGELAAALKTFNAVIDLEAGESKAAAVCLARALDVRPDFPEATVLLERAHGEEGRA